MSLVTVSTKRQRVYQRAFDHEQAIAMRKAGMTYVAIAAELGVSSTAVCRVCNPTVRAKMDEAALQHARDARESCKGGCGALVWTYRPHYSGYCQACLVALKTAGDERPGELRCTHCREWKPDDAFLLRPGRKTRHGRDSWCRACGNIARNDRRRAGERA